MAAIIGRPTQSNKLKRTIRLFIKLMIAMLLLKLLIKLIPLLSRYETYSA